ncbi:hypothetical protein WCLP8_1290004 [uncultured Gammaproteobacteria bacterium]
MTATMTGLGLLAWGVGRLGIDRASVAAAEANFHYLSTQIGGIGDDGWPVAVKDTVGGGRCEHRADATCHVLWNDGA